MKQCADFQAFAPQCEEREACFGEPFAVFGVGAKRREFGHLAVGVIGEPFLGVEAFVEKVVERNFLVCF